MQQSSPPTKRERKPTARQRRAAKLISEAKGEGTLAAAIIAAGYSENTAIAPAKVTESVGYRLALAELGLTEEFITSALVEDIKAKPQRRVEELKLGAKILNMVDTAVPITPPNVVNYNLFYQQPVQQKVKAFEQDLTQLIEHEDTETPPPAVETK